MADDVDFKAARHDAGAGIIKRLFGGYRRSTRPAYVDYSDMTTDYLFGEIWSRPGLEVRDRSLVTLAVLTATGMDKQLKVHIKGALNLGFTPDQIKEVIIHAAHYSGWPKGMNGLGALEEVLDEKGIGMHGDATADAAKNTPGA